MGWAVRLTADEKKREAAIATLMQVYVARPDLQEVYPEAEKGDLGSPGQQPGTPHKRR